jgi:hypothetical protein
MSIRAPVKVWLMNKQGWSYDWSVEKKRNLVSYSRMRPRSRAFLELHFHDARPTLLQPSASKEQRVQFIAR